MTQLAKLKAKVTEDLQESLREAAEAGEVLPIDEREVVWEYPVEDRKSVV